MEYCESRVRGIANVIVVVTVAMGLWQNGSQYEVRYIVKKF